MRIYLVRADDDAWHEMIDRWPPGPARDGQLIRVPPGCEFYEFNDQEGLKPLAEATKEGEVYGPLTLEDGRLKRVIDEKCVDNSPGEG